MVALVLEAKYQKPLNASWLQEILMRLFVERKECVRCTPKGREQHFDNLAIKFYRPSLIRILECVTDYMRTSFSRDSVAIGANLVSGVSTVAIEHLGQCNDPIEA
jgi:hypothetical protein